MEEQGKLEEAKVYLRQASSQGNADAQYRLGALLQEQGKLEETEVYS